MPYLLWLSRYEGRPCGLRHAFRMGAVNIISEAYTRRGWLGKRKALALGPGLGSTSRVTAMMPA